MKILMVGRNLKESSMQGECCKCGCIISCTSEETTRLDCCPGLPGVVYGVRCPTCNAWIYPKESEQCCSSCD